MHCPNNCHLWARGVTPNEPMTLHHPRCSHVDDSLIDVWRYTWEGESYVMDRAPSADEQREAQESEVRITRERMHREIYEQLREFAGF
jgi:hypothetical protein